MKSVLNDGAAAFQVQRRRFLGTRDPSTAPAKVSVFSGVVLLTTKDALAHGFLYHHRTCRMTYLYVFPSRPSRQRVASG